MKIGLTIIIIKNAELSKERRDIPKAVSYAGEIRKTAKRSNLVDPMRVARQPLLIDSFLCIKVNIPI